MPIEKKHSYAGILTFLFLLSHLVFAGNLQAATYYLTSTGAANAHLPASWNTVAAGGGTAASNFTTSGDIFIIPLGINGTFALSATFGNNNNVTLQINGTATLLSNDVLIISPTSTIIFTSNAIQLTIGGGSSGFVLSSNANLMTSNINGIYASTNAGQSIDGKAGTITLDPAANYEFNGTTQSTLGLPAVVNNLTFSGSGTKTIAAAVTTNGVVTINSGVTFAMSTFLLTLNGNLINNGTTSGSGGVAIAGTATQSIGSFTNTGTISMTKTAGTATLTGNASGGALTINGTGGTLNLGTGLAHTFTGDITLTTGTLNGGSSTLNANSTTTTAWTGTGSNFTAGTGTVVFGGVAQTINTPTTFNNLTLGGTTSTKTLAAAITTVGTFTINSTITIAAATNLLTLNGNLVNNGTMTGSGGVTFGGTTNQSIGVLTNTGTFTMSKTGGTATFSGNANGGALVINGTGGTLNLGTALNHTFTGDITLTSGTLNGGSSTLNANSTTATAWTGTGSNFTAGTGTVVFGGVAQTINTPTTFNNLTLGGTASTKTLAAAITTNGTLTVNAGITLAASTFALTLNGNLVNNGTTSGSGGVVIAGTATQSIGSFTNTGTISMTKTAGTATLTGNANGAALTINGTGGILNLGTGLTHTFTGDITLTAGTLNGGSSTLNANSSTTTAWTGTGSNFAAATGTVIFGGGNQTIATATTFNNLTLSNTGTKSYGVLVTVSSTLSISTGVLVNLGSINHTTSKLILGGNGQTSGTFGGSSSNATYKLSTYFTTGSTGILTVTTSSAGNGMWLGVTTDWHSTTNWTNLVIPTSVENVTIPTNPTGGNFPVISSSAVCNNLTIETGATVTNNNSLTVYGDLTGAGTLSNATASSVLNLAGASTVTTLNVSTTGNTVNYMGAAQTGKALTYSNLILSGSGAKTFTTLTVNGILSMEGTATLAGTLTYGATAALQYNTSTARSSSTAEWPSTFTATGGVIIKNTGTITLDAAKTLGNSTNVPLNINTGATLNTGTNFGLTFHGDFINNGTLVANGSPIEFAGTINQSIDNFSTSGNLSISKTAGIVTIAKSSTSGTMAFTSTGANLAVGSNQNLIVSGALTSANTATLANISNTISGAGNLTCGAVNIGNISAISSGGATTVTNNLTSTISSFSVTGDVTINSYFATSTRYFNGIFTATGGVVSIGGNVVTVNANAGNTSTVNVTSGVSNLYLGGSTPISLSGTGLNSVTLGATTVDYNRAGAQAIYATTYNNLSLSGSGVKTLAGTGTVNTLFSIGSGSSLDMSTFSLSAESITGSGTINNSAAATRTLTIGGTANLNSLTFTGTINDAAGTTSLTKNGTGTFILTGNNTYTGTTTVSSGILNIGHANALGTVAGGTTVSSGAVLEIQGGISVGNEPLILNGTGISSGGALRNISSDNTFGGPITLGSAARINSDAGILAVNNSSSITGSFNLTIGGAGNTTISGTISTGSGTVTKDGAGIATLSGSNSYSGVTTITSGIVVANTFNTAGSNSSVGTNAAINIAANGTLRYTGAATTSNRNIVLQSSGATLDASGTGDLTISGTVSGNTFNLVLTGISNGILSGVIGTTTGSVTKNSTGIWTLSGNNTYTGATIINSGTLIATNLDNTLASSLGQGTSVSIGATGTFKYTGTGHSTNRAITLLGNGASIDASGTGILTLSGTMSGAFDVVLNGTTNGVYSGVIGTSTGGITKGGTGTWTFSGTNTYSGTTNILAGTVKLGNVAALGTSTSTSVTSGAALDLNGISLSTARPVTLNGSGISTAGAMVNSSATAATYSGTITLGSATTIGGTGNITLGANGISGTKDLTKTGANNLNLGSGNVALNTLTVNAGTLSTSSGTMTVSRNLLLTGSSTTTGAGNMSVVGNVDIGSSAAFVPGAFTHNVGGNWIKTGTFTSTGSTINMNGANNTQTISGTNTFNNLTITHTGTGKVDATGSTLAVSALLHVASGNFTSASSYYDVLIAAGATLEAATGASITVSHNWTNNGTFTAATSTVSFTGASAQVIGGSTATNFYNLSMNGTGLKSLGVSITTTNTLILTSGILDIGIYNLTVAANSGGNANSYVKTSNTGRLRQSIAFNETKSYPVGLSAYNPATIKNNTSNSTDFFNIRVADEAITNANDNTKTINRKWYLNKDNAGTVNLSISLTYNDNASEKGSGFVGTSYKVGHFSGMHWMYAPATFSGTTITDGLSATDLTSAGGYLAIGVDNAFSATKFKVTVSPTPAILNGGGGIITVQSVNSKDFPTCVLTPTSFNLTVANSAFTGTSSGTIPIGDHTASINNITFTQATQGIKATVTASPTSGEVLAFGVSDPFDVNAGTIWEPYLESGPAAVNWNSSNWRKSTNGGATWIYNTAENLLTYQTIFSSDELIRIPLGYTLNANVTVSFYSILVYGTLDILSTGALTLNHSVSDGDYNVHVHGTLKNSGGTFTNSNTNNPIEIHGGTYVHARNGGNIPVANWTSLDGITSNCVVNGITSEALTGLNQTFENFTWNNASQTVIQNLDGDMTISGALTLTSGKITTETYHVILAATSTSASNASSYIVGKVRKYVPNTLAPLITFPYGDATHYAPVSVQFAGTVSGSGYIEGYTMTAKPSIASGLSQSNYINRKWVYTNSSVGGFDSYQIIPTWSANDVMGSFSSLALAIKISNSWYNSTGTNTGTTFTSSALTPGGNQSQGEFYLGESNCSATNAIWTGVVSTDWHTAGNWCFGAVPTESVDVTIPDGIDRYPVISAAAACKDITIMNAAMLTMNGAYTLDVKGSWINNGTFSAGSGTVSFSSSTALQNITGVTTFNNLTLNNHNFGIKAYNNLYVNGNVNLICDNPSSMIGVLNMESGTQFYAGANTSFEGPGDVTGIITRAHPFEFNRFYRMGHHFSGMTFLSATKLPDWVSVRVTIGTAPIWPGVNRALRCVYELSQSGSENARVEGQFFYLQSELQNANDESTLSLWTRYYQSNSTVSDRGWSDYNSTDNWVSLIIPTFSIIPSTLGSLEIALAPTANAYKTWNGSQDTDWNNAANWTPNMVPTSADGVIIPAISMSNSRSPVLPSQGQTQAVCKFLIIQRQGILNGGNSNSTLTIYNGIVSNAWSLEPQQGSEAAGNFVAGNSTVIFNSTSSYAVIGGATNFYNVTIPSGGLLSIGDNAYMGIAGALTINGTLNAVEAVNTIEFNGSMAQSIPNPNYTNAGYHNLKISGSGIKTLPSLLNLCGDFINNGTVEAGNGTVAFHSFMGAHQLMISGTSTTSFNNLTVNNDLGIMAMRDITVNGTLALPLANPSAMMGALDMGVYYLNLGPNSTITGLGDVSGRVKRNHVYQANTFYPFTSANQGFVLANLPSQNPTLSMSMKLELGTAPTWTDCTAAKPIVDPIKRVYTVWAEGEWGSATANFRIRYLPSEVPQNVNQYLLTIWSKVTNGSCMVTDLGKINQSISETASYVGIGSIPMSQMVVSENNRLITLAPSSDTFLTWNGSVSSDMNNAANWTPMAIPSSNYKLFIPVANSTNFDPYLPNDATLTAKAIELQSGGMLYGGTNSVLELTGTGVAFLSGSSDNYMCSNSCTIVLNSGGQSSFVGAITLYNLTVNANTTLFGSSSGIITISGTLTNNGTMNLLSNSNTIEFAGTGQTIPNTSANVANYSNLKISNNGTILPAALNIYRNFTYSGSGLVSAGSTVTLNGNTAQTISGSPALNNLTINNSSGGVTLAGSPTVIGTLEFTSGKISTGANRLILGAAATVSGAGAGKYIHGNLRRYVQNGTVNTFELPIGDDNNYTPALINFTGTVSGSGYLDASTSKIAPPATSSLSQTKYINRRWIINNTSVAGFTSYNATFSFVDGDKVGTPDYTKLAVAKLSNSAWAIAAIGTNTSNSTQGTGFTSFSEFAIGETDCSSTNFLWTGNISSDWNNASNWCYGLVPDGEVNVFIPVGLTNYPIVGAEGGTCKNITIENGASLGFSGNYTLNVKGNFVNSGTLNAGSGTVSFNGTVSQNINGSTTVFNNLTIDNASGVTGATNFTVNGTLSLGANPDLTHGALDMGTFILSMLNSSATVIGTGDVTGLVRRAHSFTPNTSYSFGSNYTTLSFLGNAGTTRPSEVSCRIVIGSLPTFNGVNAGIIPVKRYYQWAQTGTTGNDQINVNMSYKENELNGNAESKLVMYDYHLNSNERIDQHGKSNNSETQNWVGLTGLTINYFAPTTGLNSRIWIFDEYTTVKKLWLGSAQVPNNTSWNNATNWSLTNGVAAIPTNTDDVLIPAGLTSYPVLTSDVEVSTIEIESGASLNAGAFDISVHGKGLAWSNLGNFNPGTGTVKFIHNNVAEIVTMNGTTQFYHLYFGANVFVRPGANTYVKIAGNVNAETSSVVDLSATYNTVEYNGTSDQIFINPITEGYSFTGYYNLVFSDAGTKIFYGDNLDIAGNFINNSNLVTGDATISFIGNTKQTISGSGANTFKNIIINNSFGVESTADITVNGILNLATDNATETAGTLNMMTVESNRKFLSLGANATITGIGNVTGNIKRSHAFKNNTYYAISNANHGITFSSLPDETTVRTFYVAMKTGAPNWSCTNVPASFNPIHKEIEFWVGTESWGNALANIRTNYRLSELPQGIDPNTLTVWLKVVGSSSCTVEEKGKSNQDLDNQFITLSLVPMSNIPPAPSVIYITLAPTAIQYLLWTGSTSTDMHTASNWTPENVPSNLYGIVIPSAGNTPNDPTLSSTIVCKYITLEENAVLNSSGNSVLELQGEGLVWSQDNSSIFNYGTSKVTINSGKTSYITGSLNFYDLDIATGTQLNASAGSYTKIFHNLTNNGTIDATITQNTFEFAGNNQTIPNTSTDLANYRNLVISGSGTTLPATLNLIGNFTYNGSGLVTTGNTLDLKGTAAQTIGGTTLVPLNNLTINNIAGVSITNNAGVTIGGTASLSANNILTLNAGPVFTFSANSKVTTASGAKILLKSDAKYLNLSSSTPTLQVEREFTGIKGWRMVASPVGTTYETMFAFPFVTQGYTGSSFSTLQPNLLWWAENDGGSTLQSWRKPNSKTDEITGGRGHFFYVFNGAPKLNNSELYSDELPVTMIVNGMENAVPAGGFSYTISKTPRTSVTIGQTTETTDVTSYAGNEGWNLVGNPTASTLNWDAVSGWTKTNVDNTIYVWDPTSSQYLVWNGLTGSLNSGNIPPFQAYWVKANASSPALKFTNEVKTTNSGTFLKKGEISTSVVVPITLEGLDMSAKSYVSLSEEGVKGPDAWDAYRLQPMSDSWLALYSNSSVSQKDPLVINNLPLAVDETMNLPLYMAASEEGNSAGGECTLHWEIPANWPSDLVIELMDNTQGKAISMLKNNSYMISLTAEKNANVQAINPLNMPDELLQNVKDAAKGASLLKSATLTAYSIVIRKGNVEEKPVFLGLKPALLPLAPNPFSDQVKISFNMPEKGFVRIDVTDINGRYIGTPVNGFFPSGLNEMTWTPRTSANGTFLFRMVSNNTFSHQKAIRLK